MPSSQWSCRKTLANQICELKIKRKRCHLRFAICRVVSVRFSYTLGAERFERFRFRFRRFLGGKGFSVFQFGSWKTLREIACFTLKNFKFHHREPLGPLLHKKRFRQFRFRFRLQKKTVPVPLPASDSGSVLEPSWSCSGMARVWLADPKMNGKMDLSTMGQNGPKWSREC